MTRSVKRKLFTGWHLFISYPTTNLFFFKKDLNIHYWTVGQIKRLDVKWMTLWPLEILSSSENELQIDGGICVIVKSEVFFSNYVFVYFEPVDSGSGNRLLLFLFCFCWYTYIYLLQFRYYSINEEFFISLFTNNMTTLIVRVLYELEWNHTNTQWKRYVCIC